MITREQIVQAARAYLGTPYLHQGRVAGPNGGIDCVGLCVCVSWDLGVKPRGWNITGYRRIPDGYSLMRHLTEQMSAQVSQSAMQPGDMITLAWDRHPHHVGILGDYPHGGLSLIHADGHSRKVVEQRLVFSDRAKFVAAFAFPGVG